MKSKSYSNHECRQ